MTMIYFQCVNDLFSVVKELSFDRVVSVRLKAGHLKAGHLANKELTDVFYNAETDDILKLTSKRIQTLNTLVNKI